MSINIAVIAGTGMGQLLGEGVKKNIRTPFGKITYFELLIDSRIKIIFIDRHHSCLGHFDLPHELNHRAYMWFLAEHDVRFVIATSAVGGINGPNGIKNLTVGSIGLPMDFVDLTQKPYTFAGRESGLVHETAFHRSPINMFCPVLRDLIAHHVDCAHGILSCVQGPRYETRAEALILRDVYQVNFAGMTTAVPEVILAREAAMHYLLLANVTNMPLEDPPADGAEVKVAIAQRQERLLKVIKCLIHILHGTPPEFKCECIKTPSVLQMCEQSQD